MPSVTVKNIPAETYERLKRAAAMHHRSITGEIIVCIERAVGQREVDPTMVLATARKLRAKTASHPMTNRELARAKTTGRLRS